LRLYPILDTSLLALREMSLEDAVQILLELEVSWLQIRHKQAFDSPLLNSLERCVRRAQSTHSRLILNDRADIATMLGIGVHVGQDDLPPTEARALLGPDAIVGFSTHNRRQLTAAVSLPLTYAAIGPIFPTASKQNPDPVVGLSTLSELAPLSPVPLVAIGGITLANAASVIHAGAEKVAVISALWQPPYTLKSFQDCVTEWQQTLAQVPL
jgi:thiamine-phosphate pyrophosphorylase